MKVKVYCINKGTSSECYGLKNADENTVLHSAPNNWKTEQGAIKWAEKHGFEVQNETSRYTVTITEMLCTYVEVEAASPEEAKQLVEDQWENSEIILTADDFVEVEFEAQTSHSAVIDKETPLQKLSGSNFEKIQSAMKYIEDVTASGDYPLFRTALLISQRCDLKHNEIDKELVQLVSEVVGQYDSIFNDELNAKLEDAFSLSEDYYENAEFDDNCEPEI